MGKQRKFSEILRSTNLDQSRISIRTPFLATAVIGFLSALSIVLLANAAHRSLNRLVDALERKSQITEARLEIIHLDEVLTMSARMAAATGNDSWRVRYKNYEPVLTEAINRALSLAPTDAVRTAAHGTDLANTRLVEMEDESFEFVEQGKRDEAQQVLFSSGYEVQKQKYAASMIVLQKELAAHATELIMLESKSWESNQVILNLVVNAAHAIQELKRPEKGSIIIATRLLGNQVELAVTDTGCGIKPEIQPRIFDPFFTTKDVGKGTGQGLSLIHAIVTKNHGGAIDFKSELGSGTTFFVRLPIRQEITATDEILKQVQQESV